MVPAYLEGFFAAKKSGDNRFAINKFVGAFTPTVCDRMKDELCPLFGAAWRGVRDCGENVSPTYVTTCILRIFSDDIAEAVTVGIPDAHWGTKIVTWLRMHEGQTLKPHAELKAACSGKMAQYEIPKVFLVWEGAWPVIGIGKADLPKLEKKAQEILGVEPTDE